MTAVFLIGLLLYVGLLFVVLQGLIEKGKAESIIWYVILFLPFYITFQSLAYQQTGSEVVVKSIQYFKEILFVGALGIWLFYKRNVFTHAFRVSSLDILFLTFLTLSFFYLFIPIGPSPFVNKAIYFKNILVMGLMYFFGRNARLCSSDVRHVVRAIMCITILAFAVVLYEDVSNTHVHTHLGLAKFNEDLHDISPTGHYGLTWTFEAQDAQKRFGSIFSNPLEFASSMLFSFAICIFFILHSRFRNNQIFYGVMMLITVICVILAYSRASFLSFFMVLFFVAILAKWYKLIWTGILIAIGFVLYILYLSPKEVRYYVEDTITFQNTSSITHLIDWFEAAESMANNPLGIGLATSGNAGGVDLDNIVGGENQFLIYGVQLGWVGFAIYFSMMAMAILYSMRAYRLARTHEEKIIPFVASCVKFGFILPLMTANAESYLFIAYLSWWMVGYSVSIRNKHLYPSYQYGH